MTGEHVTMGGKGEEKGGIPSAKHEKKSARLVAGKQCSRAQEKQKKKD